MKHKIFSLLFLLLSFLAGKAQQNEDGKYVPIDKVLFD